MKTVGSFEAKTHLPELLRRVEQGESIIITKHGRPVARLVPATPAKPKPDVKQAVEAICERIERYNLSTSEPVAVAIPHPARQLMVCLALMRLGIAVAPISQGAY